VVLLDALSAKHSQVVRAVEVLHSLVVLVAQQTVDAVFIFKVDISKNTVTFHNFVQDIEIQGQLIDAFYLLHQFSADGTSHSEVVVQTGEALCAKSMAAVDEYPWNPLSHVEFFSAIVAKVKSPSLVISLG